MALTVGIPFRNAESTLGVAVRAVFAQTYEEWELILVDDGSADRSLEIARAVRDPRVRVIADGVNRGLAARLNQIVAEARFEKVARMDADDLMSPRRFEQQLDVLHNARVEIVTSAMAMLSGETPSYRDPPRRPLDRHAVNPPRAQPSARPFDGAHSVVPAQPI